MTYKNTVLIISDAQIERGQADLKQLDRLLTSRKIAASHRYVDGVKLRGIPKSAPNAIVLFFPDGDYNALIFKLSKLLRAQYGECHVPIVTVTDSPLETHHASHIDSVMLAPAFPAQLQNRICAMLRLSDIQAELDMRIETVNSLQSSQLATFDSNVPIESPGGAPLNVLFIGKAAPEFMSIMNAFEDSNVTIIAAFTPFTAFDYLHDKSFDAVVLNALSQPEPAATIIKTMRKNANLFHVPTLALVNDQNTHDFLSDPRTGASDVIDADASPAEIRSRILELANYRRTHELLKQRFNYLGGETCIESETGLFNNAFCKAHLDRHVEKARLRQSALSLAVFNAIPQSREIKDKDPDAFAEAEIQIGRMIKSMVRLQDCASRLSPSEFAILFIGETENDIQPIITRITQIIEDTVFACKDGHFKMKLIARTSQITHARDLPLAESA